MRTVPGLVLTLALAVPTLGWSRCDEPAAADAVRARLASVCVCTASTNHGQYVSCVAREVRAAVANGELPVNCKGAVTRCAARSTCGKKTGFVTCCFARPGTCESGLCQDGTTPCTVAETCPAVTKCRIKSTAEKCVGAGGAPGAGSCCDAVCGLF